MTTTCPAPPPPGPTVAIAHQIVLKFPQTALYRSVITPLPSLYACYINYKSSHAPHLREPLVFPLPRSNSWETWPTIRMHYGIRMTEVNEWIRLIGVEEGSGCMPWRHSNSLASNCSLTKDNIPAADSRCKLPWPDGVAHICLSRLYHYLSIA
jgi:hypothetical protein